MNLIVTKQLNANKTYYYPANAAAFEVVEWLRRKALVERDLYHLKRLGFTIRLKATDEVEL